MTICAKNNFTNAYYITYSNDTVYGLIDLRTNEKNAREFSFKSTAKSPVIIFYPEDIKAYRFTDNGKYYVSKKIEINGKELQLFLEYMVEGIMNLYYYREDLNKSYYFFEDKSGNISIITKEPDVVIENRYVSDYKYDGQLRYIFKDYAPIAYNPEVIQFEQSSMIDIVRTYHNNVCTTGEECIVYENSQPDNSGFKVDFGIYAGVMNFNYYSYRANNKYFASDYIAPVVSGEVIISNPRWTKVFNGFINISYSYIEGNEDATLLSNGGKDTSVNLKYNMFCKAHMVSGKLGGRFLWPTYKIQPFADAAFVYTGLIGSKRDIYNEQQVLYLSSQMRKSNMGYNLSLGVMYELNNSHKLLLGVAYEGSQKSDRSQKRGFDYFKIYQLRVGYIF